VYGWLGTTTTNDNTSVQAAPDRAGSRAAVDAECSCCWSSNDLLSSSKLSQTVGHLSLQVAAKLRTDARLHEAYDTYRYALGIFEHNPPGKANPSFLHSFIHSYSF